MSHGPHLLFDPRPIHRWLWRGLIPCLLAIVMPLPGVAFATPSWMVQIPEGAATVAKPAAAGGLQIAYSPRGERILTVAAGVARLWDADGTLERALGCDAAIESAYFLPDGQAIMAAHGPVAGGTDSVDRAGTVVFSAADGSVLHRWPGLLPVVQDGVPITSRSGDEVLSHSGNNYRLLHLNRGGMGPIISHPNATHLALSPDGRYLLSGDAAGRVMLWQTSNGRQRLMNQLGAPVGSLQFSFDGKLALSAPEPVARDKKHTPAKPKQTISIWRVKDGTEVLISNDPLARLSPSDAYLLELRGRTAVLRDLDSGRPVCTWRHKMLWPVDYGFSASGTRMTVQGQTRAESWLVTGCQVKKHRNTMMQRPRIAAMTMAKDGSRALTEGDGMAQLWVFPSRKRPIGVLKNWPNPQVPYPVDFSPDGSRLLAVDGADSARIIALPTGEVIATLSHGPKGDSCLPGAPF